MLPSSFLFFFLEPPKGDGDAAVAAAVAAADTDASAESGRGSRSDENTFDLRGSDDAGGGGWPCSPSYTTTRWSTVALFDAASADAGEEYTTKEPGTAAEAEAVAVAEEAEEDGTGTGRGGGPTSALPLCTCFLASHPSVVHL